MRKYELYEVKGIGKPGDPLGKLLTTVKADVETPDPDEEPDAYDRAKREAYEVARKAAKRYRPTVVRIVDVTDQAKSEEKSEEKPKASGKTSGGKGGKKK